MVYIVCVFLLLVFSSFNVTCVFIVFVPVFLAIVKDSMLIKLLVLPNSVITNWVPC